MTELGTQASNLEIRPHHAEGALKALATVFHGWNEISEGATVEPETLIEMFFDAEDCVITSTPEETRQDIETKWRDDPNFQKIRTFLEQHKVSLAQERDRQLEMFQDAAKYLAEATPDNEKTAIEAKWKDDEFYDWQLGEFRTFHEAQKRTDPATADEKLLQMAREKTAYTNPDKSLFPHREMYQKIKEVYDADPMGAQITFVNDYDFICQKCIAGGKVPPCLGLFGVKGKELVIDSRVVEVHGWEFNKPYNLGEALKSMIIEASRRKIFLLCADDAGRPEFIEQWAKDVAESKLG